MYKAVIIYMGAAYENTLNAIKISKNCLLHIFFVQKDFIYLRDSISTITETTIRTMQTNGFL